MNRIARIAASALASTVVAAGLTTMAVPQAEAATNNCYGRIFNMWSPDHSCVRQIQTLLRGSSDSIARSAGWTSTLAVDGYYGSATASAVRTMQNRVNYYIGRGEYGEATKLVVDGSVGPHTWRYLCRPAGAMPDGGGYGPVDTRMRQYNAAWTATCSGRV